MKPNLGDIVIYRLNQYDRNQLYRAGASVANNGGDESPAIVTRVFSDTCVNLRVIVDGVEPLWATSRSPGDEPGQWRPRA